MRLLSVPHKPKKLAHTPREMIYDTSMPETWRGWLRDAVYWDGELTNG